MFVRDCCARGVCSLWIGEFPRRHERCCECVFPGRPFVSQVLLVFFMIGIGFAYYKEENFLDPFVPPDGENADGEVRQRKLARGIAGTRSTM